MDEKSGRISIQEKKYKLYIWRFIFGLQCLHLAYGLIRFIQLLFSPDLKQKMDHVFIHSMVLGYMVVIFWSYQIFIKRPSETVMLFNQLFNHQQNNTGTTNVFPKEDIKSI